MAVFDNEAYKEELKGELAQLIEKQKDFWTEYKEYRIVELSKRLGIPREFRNEVDYQQDADILDQEGAEAAGPTGIQPGQ